MTCYPSPKVFSKESMNSLKHMHIRTLYKRSGQFLSWVDSPSINSSFLTSYTNFHDLRHALVSLPVVLMEKYITLATWTLRCGNYSPNLQPRSNIWKENSWSFLLTTLWVACLCILESEKTDTLLMLMPAKLMNSPSSLLTLSRTTIYPACGWWDRCLNNKVHMLVLSKGLKLNILVHQFTTL